MTDAHRAAQLDSALTLASSVLAWALKHCKARR